MSNLMTDSTIIMPKPDGPIFLRYFLARSRQRVGTLGTGWIILASFEINVVEEGEHVLDA